jgi:hypothetical protein
MLNCYPRRAKMTNDWQRRLNREIAYAAVMIIWLLITFW